MCVQCLYLTRGNLKTWRMAGIVHVFSNFSGYDSVPWTCTHDSCMMRTWYVSYWLAIFGWEFSATIFGSSYFWCSAGELFVFQDNVLLNLRLTIKGCYVFFRHSVDLSVLFRTNLGAKIVFVLCVDNCITKNPCQSWKDKMDGKNDNIEGPNPRKLYKTTLKSHKGLRAFKTEGGSQSSFLDDKGNCWNHRNPTVHAIPNQLCLSRLGMNLLQMKQWILWPWIAWSTLLSRRFDVVMWVVSVPQDRNQPQKAYCNNHLIKGYRPCRRPRQYGSWRHVKGWWIFFSCWYQRCCAEPWLTPWSFWPTSNQWQAWFHSRAVKWEGDFCRFSSLDFTSE